MQVRILPWIHSYSIIELHNFVVTIIFLKASIEEKKRYVQLILLYEFNKSNDANGNAKNINASYDNPTVSVSQRQRSFRNS